MLASLPTSIWLITTSHISLGINLAALQLTARAIDCPWTRRNTSWHSEQPQSHQRGTEHRQPLTESYISCRPCLFDELAARDPRCTTKSGCCDQQHCSHDLLQQQQQRSDQQRDRKEQSSRRRTYANELKHDSDEWPGDAALPRFEQ